MFSFKYGFITIKKLTIEASNRNQPKQDANVSYRILCE